jgi:oligoendopeptidase F
MAATAFRDRWIDGEPRDGKRGGAYCMGVMAIEQSRILANFDGSFDQVSTLAHELGHGFHNHCQKGLEPLQRGAPMTLAETASIFCETLIAEAALEGASRDERLMILEVQLAGATQVCLDISSRFLFESKVFDERPSGELSADELCRIMKDAQSQTYGEAIDPATYQPYMWLWKPHYYSYDLNYYNFPYAFGHLFALGLYAEFKRQGAGFVEHYQKLLRSTGQDYAAPLVKQFGIDITKADFWRRSLAIIEGQLERFEAL